MNGIAVSRDILFDVAGETFAEVPAGRRYRHKLDTVETFPALSVYTGQVESEPAAMRGVRRREVEYRVELYRADVADLEEVFLGDAEELESAVETARRAGRFPDELVEIYLSAAVMSFTPDGRGRTGSVSVVFNASFSNSIL